MEIKRWMPLLVAGIGACDGAAFDVTIYGESFIEDGIPADVMSDGWAVTFDGFVVSLRDVEVGGVSAGSAQEFDLTAPSAGAGQQVVSVDAPADADVVQYTITSLDLTGTAQKAGAQKSFAWRFDDEVKYGPCALAAGRREAQITVHADHLFYDDLDSPDPDARFGLIAQADDDGDSDGDITAAELAGVDITALSNYLVGSRDVDNLWDFISAQSRTVGHINGEGHCEAE